MKELYFSIDVETDGPIPGPHSMLSLGCAVFDTALIDTFSVNLNTLPDASGHPETMAWWATQPIAWQATRENVVEPDVGLGKFVDWVNSFEGSAVAVAYPAGFDFMFLYWYLIKFGYQSPFSFSCLDMKTYAMALLGTSYRKSNKKSWPKKWFSKDKRHTHVAVEDAVEQGYIFLNMLSK